MTETLIFIPANASVIGWITEQCNLSPWDWIACFAGVVSLVVAIVTAILQKQTENNTQKMSRGVQVSRLKGFYRHLYRNMIKVRAMEILRQRELANGSNRVPSAEHFLKLQLDEEDICAEAFYSDTIIFEALKKLKLEVRNVNIEIKIADRYMSSSQSSRESRLEIMKVLLMKQGAIAETITEVLEKNFKESNVHEHAKEVMFKSHEDTLEKNKDPKKYGKLKPHEHYNNENCGLCTIYNKATNLKEAEGFLSIFNKDVEIELGRNSDDEPKIVLV